MKNDQLAASTTKLIERLRANTLPLDVAALALPVVDALRELEAERQRHFDALTRLDERLRELTKGDIAHHHLPLPNSYYQQKIRDQLFPDLELTASP